MSNASIVGRLSDEVRAYARRERTSEEFGLTLYFAIEAMECLTQDHIRQLRRFQGEVDRFDLEERSGRMLERHDFTERLSAWLHTLPQNA